MSVKKLQQAGVKVTFENSEVKLIKNKNLIGLGKRENLYEISFSLDFNESLNVENISNDLFLWHRSYGHIGFTGLKEIIITQVVKGLENVKINAVTFCEPCVMGKITRLPFEVRKKSKRILEIITFIDDYSKKTKN